MPIFDRNWIGVHKYKRNCTVASLHSILFVLVDDLFVVPRITKGTILGPSFVRSARRMARLLLAKMVTTLFWCCMCMMNHTNKRRRHAKNIHGNLTAMAYIRSFLVSQHLHDPDDICFHRICVYLVFSSFIALLTDLSYHCYHSKFQLCLQMVRR